MAAPGSEEHLYRHETEAHTKARKKKNVYRKLVWTSSVLHTNSSGGYSATRSPSLQQGNICFKVCVQLVRLIWLN